MIASHHVFFSTIIIDDNNNHYQPLLVSIINDNLPLSIAIDISIQWLGGTDSELGVFIFPTNIPFSMWSRSELQIEFPNHLTDFQIATIP